MAAIKQVKSGVFTPLLVGAQCVFRILGMALLQQRGTLLSIS
jgi:hypothetical protein